MQSFMKSLKPIITSAPWSKADRALKLATQVSLFAKEVTKMEGEVVEIKRVVDSYQDASTKQLIIDTVKVANDTYNDLVKLNWHLRRIISTCGTTGDKI